MEEVETRHEEVDPDGSVERDERVERSVPEPVGNPNPGDATAEDSADED